MTTTNLLAEALSLLARARAEAELTQTKQTDNRKMNMTNTSYESSPLLAGTDSSAETLQSIVFSPASTHTTASPEVAGQLYVGGKSVIEVAQYLGITYGKARRLIRESGTPIRDASSRLKGRTRRPRGSE